jgi:hypothetical protein
MLESKKFPISLHKSLGAPVLNFPLDFHGITVVEFQCLKAMLFAGAEGGAGGLEFQQLKKRVKSKK